MPKANKLRYAGRSEFRQIEKLLRKGALNSLTTRHRIGLLVERLVPAANRAYGQRSLAVLAEELGLPPTSTTLTHARAFARLYTRGEVCELDASIPGSSFRMTWGHVIRLLAIPRPERVRLERECQLGKWTNAELDRQIRLRWKRTNKGGAPLKRPGSVVDTLIQVQVMTESWIKRSQELWIGGAQPIITPEMIAKARREAGETLAATIDVLQQLEYEVARLRSTLEAAARRPVRRSGK